MASLESHTHAGFAGLLLISLAVCLAIAGVSYAVVERPFLRLRRRWGSTVAEQSGGGLGRLPRYDLLAADRSVASVDDRRVIARAAVH